MRRSSAALDVLGSFYTSSGPRAFDTKRGEQFGGVLAVALWGLFFFRLGQVRGEVDLLQLSDRYLRVNPRSLQVGVSQRQRITPFTMGQVIC